MSAIEKKFRSYVYKCRICGESTKILSGFFSSLDGVKVLRQLQDGKSVQLPLGGWVCAHEVHVCADGSVGISDIQGFVLDKE